MIKPTILVTLFVISQNSWSKTCTKDSNFVKFVEDRKVFLAENPRLLVNQYAEQNKLSFECVMQKIHSMIPDYALAWKQKAIQAGCFEIPFGANCPEETRKEIKMSVVNLES